MNIKQKLRKILWRFGYDIKRYPQLSDPLARRKQIFVYYDIDVVLDIGANIGQFAFQLRNDLGYKKRIISFEPLSSAFEVLKAKAKNDPYWEVFNFALGDTEGREEINIAGNSYSSSLLNMLPSHIKAAPGSKYVGKEIIEVKSLETIYYDLCNLNNNVYMKIDTQGFELKVLEGSKKVLMNINTIQIEMSLVPLYEGSLLFNEMYRYMVDQGYSLVSIEPGFIDKNSGQLLQVDGIFHRF
jgi:FkbM family methyltransferase